jgi:uncharacterized alkaline shock family protein YloU
MNDDAKFIELIEKEVLAFRDVSRFADPSLTENIQTAFGRGLINPGIKITEEDELITINLDIIVYFGVNIPQLCYDIQTKVKNNIEKETGLEIKAVNITVEGIDEREPDNQESK